MTVDGFLVLETRSPCFSRFWIHKRERKFVADVLTRAENEESWVTESARAQSYFLSLQVQEQY